MADNKGVLVVGDIIEGKMAAITAEMLGAGKKLAEKLGEPLSAALLGSGVKGLAAEAIAFGAEKVFVVDDANLKDYQSDAYVTAMESVIKQANPRIVLFGQSTVGRDLAPRLAFRFNTAISMDCVDLDVDANKLLVQTKPVYGGNAKAIFTTEALPQMATVRPKAMTALPRDDAKKGEVVDVASGIDPAKIRTKFVKKIKEEVAGVKLEDAPAVIAGGRGIGGPDGFKQLEELAKAVQGRRRCHQTGSGQQLGAGHHSGRPHRQDRGS